MLYELIANADRVTETIAREYSDRAPVNFELIADDSAPDSDPLCDDSRYGERLSRGFALLGCTE